MVQAGERAAFLEQVLTSLAVFLERLDDLRGQGARGDDLPDVADVAGHRA